MRDRRHLRGSDRNDGDVAMRMPLETKREREEKQRKIEARGKRKGILSYLVFLFLFLGIPLMIVVHFTPFFVFQNLRCRLQDKLLRPDHSVKAMEDGYLRYFEEPPLFQSAEFNRSMRWGTYDPTRIFAVKSRSEKPVTIGLAWYDAAKEHALRHIMPYVHNKVNPPRSARKQGRDAEVMQVRWVVHDGLHYAKETVRDSANKASFEIELLKSPFADAWHVRVHCTSEGDSPLVMVVYMTQGDEEEGIEIGAPDGHNDGDWSPVLKSRLRTQDDMPKTAFSLRVYDDHNPFFDTASWHIYGLQTDVDEAFSLTSPEALGVTPAERAAAGGRGITGGKPVGDLQKQQLDLRELPHDAFSYITSKDPNSFTAPENGVRHNVMVLKKTYDSSFRLQLSLSPADYADPSTRKGSDLKRDLIPQYETLSTCQLTSILRWREKLIYKRTKKLVDRWLSSYLLHKSRLNEKIASITIGELFGSMSYSHGRYLEVEPAEDQLWDQQGVAPSYSSLTNVTLSAKAVGALSTVGSRTDEPYGLAAYTGAHLLFLLRWNREMAKDMMASWLLSAQNPETGFVPTRAIFTADVRSFAPASFRYEHPTFASPPTLLLGLQELLNSVERKSTATTKSRQRAQKGERTIPHDERSPDDAFFASLLPALKRWRDWWHRTQCGGATPELALHCSTRKTLEEWPRVPAEGHPEDLLVYRWRGRDGERLSSSGMEDYPRPVCPGEHYREAHVDSFSWIAMMSRLISRIEVEHLHIEESVKVDWEAHLDAVHWDAANKRYSDHVGCNDWGFSPYVGYVNLYPVMLGVVRKDMEKVRHTIALAQRDLATAFGLMSVSFDSVGLARKANITHNNMWMGFVWPQTNVMFLYGLKSVYAQLMKPVAGSPFTEREREDYVQLMSFYEELRQTMIETVYFGSRWWEYFNPVDGRGEGSKTHVSTRVLLLNLLDNFE